MQRMMFSSTGRDLGACRQAAIKVCNSLGLQSIAMEFFEANVIEIDSQLKKIRLLAHHILNLASVWHQPRELEAARERYLQVLAMLDPVEGLGARRQFLPEPRCVINAQRGQLEEACRPYRQASEAFAALGTAAVTAEFEDSVYDYQSYTLIIAPRARLYHWTDEAEHAVPSLPSRAVTSPSPVNAIHIQTKTTKLRSCHDVG